MISNVANQSIPYKLSKAAQKAYSKIKALIMRIFSLLKCNEKQDLKEEFYDSYIDFARKLDDEGYYEESYCYMDICAMYHDLMDRPDDLIAHESFFLDLFNAFDELLFVRINQLDEYEKKFDEFLLYSGRMQQYYYTKVAVPSQNYDEDVCKVLINRLSGGIE